jgi:hypothetical protein
LIYQGMRVQRLNECFLAWEKKEKRSEKKRFHTITITDLVELFFQRGWRCRAEIFAFLNHSSGCSCSLLSSSQDQSSNSTLYFPYPNPQYGSAQFELLNIQVLMSPLGLCTIVGFCHHGPSSSNKRICKSCRLSAPQGQSPTTEMENTIATHAIILKSLEFREAIRAEALGATRSREKSWFVVPQVLKTKLRWSQLQY